VKTPALASSDSGKARPVGPETYRVAWDDDRWRFCRRGFRNSDLAPDWLRIGTDIINNSTPPPTFNMTFSLL